VTERSAAGLHALRIETDHLANDARRARGRVQTPLVTADKCVGCVVLVDVGVARFVVPAHDPVRASVGRWTVIASLAVHRYTVPQASRPRARDHTDLRRVVRSRPRIRQSHLHVSFRPLRWTTAGLPLDYRWTDDPNQTVSSGFRRSFRVSQNPSKTGVFAGK